MKAKRYALILGLDGTVDPVLNSIEANVFRFNLARSGYRPGPTKLIPADNVSEDAVTLLELEDGTIIVPLDPNAPAAGWEPVTGSDITLRFRGDAAALLKLAVLALDGAQLYAVRNIPFTLPALAVQVSPHPARDLERLQRERALLRAALIDLHSAVLNGHVAELEDATARALDVLSRVGVSS